MIYEPVYHGTDRTFRRFKREFIGTGTYSGSFGFWFSSKPEAAGYFGENIIVARLEIENPLHVSFDDFIGNMPHEPAWWATEAFLKSHDAVILHNVIDGYIPSTVYCVFEEEQVEILTPGPSPTF